jgi:hypothetical protein
MNKALFSLVSALALTAALLVHPAPAAQVAVEEPLPGDASTAAQARQTAMDKGFAQASLAEAQILLPQALDERRTELLKDYLSRRGNRFVQSYKETGFETLEGRVRLTLDVVVNRDELSRHLQRLGLFATGGGALRGITLTPGNLLPADRQSVDRLMALSGLKAEQGLWPEFAFSRVGQGQFEGQFRTPERTQSFRDKDLEVVWFQLASNVFSAQEAKPQSLSGARLVVQGWASPDGVQEFDRVLKTWEAEAAGATLTAVNLEAKGVSASWSLKVLNQAALEARLREYLPQHGLTHSFP